MLTGILLTAVVLCIIAAMFKWVYSQVTFKKAHRHDPETLLQDYMSEMNHISSRYWKW